MRVWSVTGSIPVVAIANYCEHSLFYIFVPSGSGEANTTSKQQRSKMINIRDIGKPFHSLRKPRTYKDWEKVLDTAVSKIDSTPDGKPADIMSAILKCLVDNFRLAVTRTEVRNCLFDTDDYDRCLRTFISLAEKEQVELDMIERILNSEKDVTAAKYYDTYRGEEGKEEFDFCMGVLFISAVIKVHYAEEPVFDG